MWEVRGIELWVKSVLNLKKKGKRKRLKLIRLSGGAGWGEHKLKLNLNHQSGFIRQCWEGDQVLHYNLPSGVDGDVLGLFWWLIWINQSIPLWVLSVFIAPILGRPSELSYRLLISFYRLIITQPRFHKEGHDVKKLKTNLQRSHFILCYGLKDWRRDNFDILSNLRDIFFQMGICRAH